MASCLMCVHKPLSLHAGSSGRNANELWTACLRYIWQLACSNLQCTSTCLSRAQVAAAAVQPEVGLLPGLYPGLNNCDYHNLIRIALLMARARWAALLGDLQAAEVRHLLHAVRQCLWMHDRMVVGAADLDRCSSRGVAHGQLQSPSTHPANTGMHVDKSV